MPLMSIRDLEIKFPEKLLFDKVNLDVDENDFIVITTGVMDGATSFIRSLLGLVPEAKGEVLFDGINILKPNNQKELLNARKKIGLVYEANGLISMINVYQNIGFPLGYHTSLSDEEIKLKIDAVCEDLAINDILLLEPNQLNDTQTRIVNLARALVVEPKVLLIDELEGGMSESALEQLIDIIKKYQKKHNFGVVMTTLIKDIHFSTRHYEIKKHKLFEVKYA